MNLATPGGVVKQTKKCGKVFLFIFFFKFTFTDQRNVNQSRIRRKTKFSDSDLSFEKKKKKKKSVRMMNRLRHAIDIRRESHIIYVSLKEEAMDNLVDFSPETVNANTARH